MNRKPMLIALAWLLTMGCVLSAVALAGDYDLAKDVAYVERSGKPILSDLYVPKGEGPFPAVLVVHGGAWRSGNKMQLATFAERLAQNGYTAVAISYRLAPEFVFPAQIEDCKSAVRFMRKNAAKYKIDSNRMGAMGYSAGGHLVALLGTTDATCGLEGPDADGTDTRLQCIVAGGAPCDFCTLPEDGEMLAFWLGGTRHNKQQVYEQASPLSYVTKDDPPIFFFHGGKDNLVVFDTMGPKTTIARLNELGVTNQVCIIKGADHVPAMINPKASEESLKFFDEYLKNGKPAAK